MDVILSHHQAPINGDLTEAQVQENLVLGAIWEPIEWTHAGFITCCGIFNEKFLVLFHSWHVLVSFLLFTITIQSPRFQDPNAVFCKSGSNSIMNAISQNFHMYLPESNNTWIDSKVRNWLLFRKKSKKQQTR